MLPELGRVWVSLRLGTWVLVDRKTRMPQGRAEDKSGIIRRLGQGKRILKLNGLNGETRRKGPGQAFVGSALQTPMQPQHNISTTHKGKRAAEAK
jgi:hypothetical protein